MTWKIQSECLISVEDSKDLFMKLAPCGQIVLYV